MPLQSSKRREINGLDIGPHQIVESDEDDVPSYGFPSQNHRRNRRGCSPNIDDVLGNRGSLLKNLSLLLQTIVHTYPLFSKIVNEYFTNLKKNSIKLL